MSLESIWSFSNISVPLTLSTPKFYCPFIPNLHHRSIQCHGVALRPWVDLVVFRIFWKLKVGHYQCHKVWHSTIKYGFMPWARLKFDTTRNTRPHCLECVIGVLFLIFPTAVFNSLMCILLELFGSTSILLCSCWISVCCHRPRVLLFGISVYFLISSLL